METIMGKPLVEGLVIADDHRLILLGLETVLKGKNISANYYFASNGLEVLEQLAQYVCNVVLIDYRMPKMDGLTCTRKIRELYPAVKIICLSGVAEDKIINEAFESGVHGYVCKTENENVIVEAFGVVLKNEKFISEKAEMVLKETKSEKPQCDVKSYPKPSKREIEIVERIAKGMTYKKIKEELSIEISTIKKSMERARAKFKVEKTICLVEIFRELG